MVREIRAYINQYSQFPDKYRKSIGKVDLIRYFRPWCELQKTGRSPLHDRMPWLTFSAIDFLRRQIKPSMRVFEYGSGGSTLFYAELGADVISIEHDADWFKSVEAATQHARYAKCTVSLVVPQLDPLAATMDPSDPDAYVSSDEPSFGKSYKEYVTAIDAYPDESFDVIVIDGRSRPSCFKHAISKVKKNGLIVWDNTDRATYARGMQMAPKSWQFLDFPGPGAYLDYFTRTSVWKVK